MGNRNYSETMYPGRITSEILSYDILDRRGYFDDSLKANGVISSALLVDAYLHKTDKVILVILIHLKSIVEQRKHMVCCHLWITLVHKV